MQLTKSHIDSTPLQDDSPSPISRVDSGSNLSGDSQITGETEKSSTDTLSEFSSEQVNSGKNIRYTSSCVYSGICKNFPLQTTKYNLHVHPTPSSRVQPMLL